MKKYDVIVIGAGLAGLTAAYELITNNKSILLIEKEKFLGGRTSSWNDEGMIVEAGFHRHIGFYKELPKILKKVGIKINNIVMWEKELEIKISETKSIVLGIDPICAPLKFLRGIINNNDLLTSIDKLSLLRFFTIGFKDYILHPKKLDNYSVTEYAAIHKVTKKALNYILTPLSTGIFFLPPEEYSSKVFFGLFTPGLPRLVKVRIGAYLGGMSDVLAHPIGKAFEKEGGIIKLDTEVIKLLKEDDKIVGVKLKNKEKIYAKDIVLATDLIHAKDLLKSVVKDDPWFESIFKIPTMSAVTIQFNLKEPALLVDRTTFGPLTILTSFAEQSRSTFTHVPGRLSVILSNPNEHINLSDKKIFNRVIEEAKLIGLDLKEKIIDYRVIRHKDKFYHLGPRHDHLRPPQKTPIEGLTLAGDYTRQPLYATMEGAVISGIKAAKIISKNS